MENLSRRIPPIPSTQDMTTLIQAVNDRFRRLQAELTAEGAAEPQQDGQGGRRGIGWDLQNTAVGVNVSDPVVPNAFTPSACSIRINVSDSAHPLKIDIKNNGTSIFRTLPLIPAGTSTRAVQKFTGFTNEAQINDDDDVTIDVLQGGAWQVCVYLE